MFMRSRLSIVCLAVMIMLIVGSVVSSGAERMGAWVDDIVVIEEQREPAAIGMLLAGELDMYAQTMSDQSCCQVEASPELTYSVSYGGYTSVLQPGGPSSRRGSIRCRAEDQRGHELVDRSRLHMPGTLRRHGHS